MNRNFLHPLTSDDELKAGVRENSRDITLATAATVLGNDTG